MTPQRFEHLLTLVAPFLKKKHCRSRVPISPEERLVVTIRYLATGDSQQSQSFNFRLGKSTVCQIIKETCDAIWNALNETFLSAPEKKEDWEKIAREFEDKWNFPNCLGALDGKHVAMECPKNQGSACYNYKGFHSLVLLAVCDANYCFSLVDIGGNGGDNDASIFAQSEMGMAFNNNEIDFPEPKTVNGHNLPHVLVGDEIFKLETWLMKPYPGRDLTPDRSVYNYRLSRCRRTIENTFGILSAKWRIFRRPIRASITTVDRIIKACVCLHNYLKQLENANYTPRGFVDSEDANGNFLAGTWRSIVSTDESALHPIKKRSCNNFSKSAKATRDSFKTYFNSKAGSVFWQKEHVESCGDTLI